MRSRIFILAGIIAVLLAVIVVPTVRAINSRIFPFFDPEQTYFADLRPTAGTKEHIETAAAVFSAASNMPREDITAMLSAIIASEPARFGSFLKDGTVYFYARNPLRPVVLPDAMKEQWISTEWQLQRDNYVLFSPAVAAAQPRQASLAPFWSKVALYRLSSQDRGVLYIKNSRFPQPLYGSFDDLGGAWRLQLAASAWKVGNGVESTTLPLEASFFLRQTSAIGAMAEKIAWTESIAALWNSPMAQAFRVPGEITVVVGTFDAFVQNPFSAALAWQAEISTSQQEANAFLEQILRDLAKRYPMAFERVLPDKSKVYELKTGKEQFLTEGAVIDLAIQPQGVMTYPQGQVVYQYADEVFQLEHGDIADKVKLSTLSCGVADPELEMLISADFVGTQLWRKMFFGLNQRNGVVCIFW